MIVWHCNWYISCLHLSFSHFSIQLFYLLGVQVNAPDFSPFISVWIQMCFLLIIDKYFSVSCCVSMGHHGTWNLKNITPTNQTSAAFYLNDSPKNIFGFFKFCALNLNFNNFESNTGPVGVEVSNRYSYISFSNYTKPPLIFNDPLKSALFGF